MVKQTYSEKLRDPRWQKKRLEILQRDNFTCKLCSDGESELHIHHKSYTKGAQPWEYDNDNFITYCKHCHAVVEGFKDQCATAIIATKVFNNTYSCFVTSTILNHPIDGLMLAVNAHNNNGTLDYLLSIKRDTLISFEKLFQYSEKLIFDAKPNAS